MILLKILTKDGPKGPSLSSLGLSACFCQNRPTREELRSEEQNVGASRRYFEAQIQALLESIDSVALEGLSVNLRGALRRSRAQTTQALRENIGRGARVYVLADFQVAGPSTPEQSS